jgi:hypothetical protein
MHTCKLIDSFTNPNQIDNIKLVNGDPPLVSQERDTHAPLG